MNEKIFRELTTNPPVENGMIKWKGVQYERNPGAEYGTHIQNTGVICNTSATHTYGNVITIVEKYLLSEIFSPDAFQTVTTSTMLASRQITYLPTQLQKKELPILVLIPRIVFGQDENRFLGHTIFNDRYTNTDGFWGYGSLEQLAYDRKHHLYVHGHYNRAVLYIDVVCTFNTYAEQINYLNQLYNINGVNHNRYIRAPLELYIPKELCELIQNLVKIPIHDEHGSVQPFLSYLNSTWFRPMTYKLKGGSNNDEFFMYYLTDMDFVIQDPQYGTGNKEGQVRHGFDITFTIRCDFNTIGYFMLNSPEIKRPVQIKTHDQGGIVPIFSDVINLNDFQLPVGWTILGWPIFKLEYGKNTMDIDPILNQSIRVVIQRHLELGIPMERFISIQFREDGQILDHELYYIDWRKRELVLLQPNYRRTYRLIIMVSYDYINEQIKEMYDLE